MKAQRLVEETESSNRHRYRDIDWSRSFGLMANIEQRLSLDVLTDTSSFLLSCHL